MLTEFDIFYHENALYVLRMACKYVPMVKAEDIVQNVFIEVWKRWGHIEKKADYLRQAVKLRCFDEIKRISTEPIDESEVDDLKEVANDQTELLMSALAQVNPVHRQIIEYLIYGYSPKEICKITGLSMQTVKNKKRLAVIELKSILLHKKDH